MEYIKAEKDNLEKIFDLVQNTIAEIYPKYYPKDVVAFFQKHHSKANIVNDIENGCVNILLLNGKLVGTGSYQENHITRVFVNPNFQGKGYGSYIIGQLENEISKRYDTINLDASLPACGLYEHRGYKTLKHESLVVENGAVLVYEIMEKQIR